MGKNLRKANSIQQVCNLWFQKMIFYKIQIFAVEFKKMVFGNKNNFRCLVVEKDEELKKRLDEIKKGANPKLLAFLINH